MQIAQPSPLKVSASDSGLRHDVSYNVRTLAIHKGLSRGALRQAPRHIRKGMLFMRTTLVLVIGAPKCGTTTLHSVLSQFPDGVMSNPKEPAYFVRDDLQARGLTYYRRQFFDYRPGVSWLGEATPWYLYRAEALQRIREQGEFDPLFVVCLRDPVERARSMYWDQVRAGWETRSIEEALDPNEFKGVGMGQMHDFAREDGGRLPQRYIACGFYATALRPWISVFGDDKFMYVDQASLRDPSALAEDLARFIGTRPPLHLNPVEISRNAAGTVRSTAVREAMRRLDAWESPLKRRLRALVPEAPLHRFVGAVQARNRSAWTPPRMPAALRRELQSLYGPSVLNLEELTGLDLSTWESRPV